jgi:hypothetical protein
MVDYCVINPASFYARKKIIPNEKLQAKVNDIIERHKCFREESIHMLPSHAVISPTKPQHRKNHHHHRGGFHSQHRPPMPFARATVRPPKLINMVSSVDPSQREINGYLNKISPKNYSVIQAKLLQFCMHHPSQISTIAKTLFEKCVSQKCFAGLYMSLILKLDEISKLEVRDAAKSFVDEWTSAICDNLTQLEVNYTAYNASYDDMCKCFKLKGMIISKNRCVLELIKCRLIDMDYAQYWKLMWNSLIHQKDNIQAIDTLTQCFIDQCDVSGIEYLDGNDFVNINMFYNEVIMEECGMNTQFKWRDFMGLLGIVKN